MFSTVKLFSGFSCFLKQKKKIINRKAAEYRKKNTGNSSFNNRFNITLIVLY